MKQLLALTLILPNLAQAAGEQEVFPKHLVAIK